MLGLLDIDDACLEYYGAFWSQRFASMRCTSRARRKDIVVVILSSNLVHKVDLLIIDHTMDHPVNWSRTLILYEP